MKAELKQKWIDALRSGRYAQGSGQLLDSDEEYGREDYCCLGVLADVAGLKPHFFPMASFLGEDRQRNTDHCGLGPSESPGDPDYNADDEATLTNLQRKLAAMNDNGKSFAEIADWIEANVPADAPL